MGNYPNCFDLVGGGGPGLVGSSRPRIAASAAASVIGEPDVNDGCEVVLLPNLKIPDRLLNGAAQQQPAKHYLDGLAAYATPGVQSAADLDKDITSAHPEQQATAGTAKYVTYDNPPRKVVLYHLAPKTGSMVPADCKSHLGFEVSSFPDGTTPDTPYDFAVPRAKTMAHYHRVWYQKGDPQYFHVVLK
jgi:hypothetical protein